jgi:hypothetical protein
MCPSRFDLSDPDAVAFCPSCGAGYLAGVTHCSQCEVELESRAAIEVQVAQDALATPTGGSTREVYSTTRPLDAQMLMHALQEKGVAAELHGQSSSHHLGQPVSIWVPEEQSAVAGRIISIIEASQPDAQEDEEDTERQPPATGRSTSRFHAGLLMGLVLGYGALVFQNWASSREASRRDSDRNGDGVQDAWAKYSILNNELVRTIYDSDFDGSPDRWDYYENGLVARSESDRNRDGKPDFWWFYNEMGQLLRMELDDDSDGQADSWTLYENDLERESTSDLDFDGQIDEWIVFENGFYKERRISFRNDGVVDKRILYDRNRRARVEYDRDRDGDFEEVRMLDPFEEVASVIPHESSIR